MPIRIFLAIMFIIILAVIPYSVVAQQNSMPESFPGYEPKTTPDTILDYRSSLEPKIQMIPPGDLDHLFILVRLIEKQNELAKKNPGQWLDGHVGLGADPKEYHPSDDELVASEIGKKIKLVGLIASKEEMQEALAKSGVESKGVVYNEFTFRHVDVMGSGRFFYASPPKRVEVSFR